METTLGKLSKTVADLTTIVEESKNLMVTDPTDKIQRERAKKAQHSLRDHRNNIKDEGMSLRKKANDFSKAVIKKEKELLAIIKPEEDRFKDFEVEIKAVELKEKRDKQLPERKERLEKIGDDVVVKDDFLSVMDNNQFDQYVNQRVSDKLESDRIKAEKEHREEREKLQAETNKLAKEKAEIRRKEELKNAEENARKDEIRKAELKETQRKIDEEEAEVKRVADKKKAEDDKKKEAELLAKREEYIKFREEHGWTEATRNNFFTKEDSGVISLFKKVGVFVK